MKKLFLTIAFVTALAVAAMSQPLTNGVKTSSFPLAGVLAGTEYVPILQGSPLSNRLATVSQVIALPSGQAMGASNVLSAQIVTQSNLVVGLIGELTAYFNLEMASLAATNGTVLQAIASTNSALAGAIVSSNSAARASIIATNDALTAALNNASNVLNNAIAAALAGVPTNGGTLTVPALSTPNIYQPSTNWGSISAQTNVWLDFSQPQFNSAQFTNNFGNMFLTPTNVTDGSQYYFYASSTRTMTINLNTKVSGYTMLNAGNGIAVSAGGNFFVNYIVIGNKIIVSGGTF